ncbi:Crp/Fnr family transcriptional regulator [Siminovitchia sediminis]|uniref:Crp/Fnr family transcriptional regulator n=1 Tax=Siminovitchia sediminis TaxID=1274353 RepID=A0ABW4KGT9_9BACI
MSSLQQTVQNPWVNYLVYGKRLFFKEQSIIFNQGVLGEGFYYIEKGLVKILSKTANNTDRILNVAGHGQLIGEQVIDDLPYFSTAVCHKDSIVYFFSKQDYRKMIQHHPEVITLLAQSLIQKEKLLLNNINITHSDTEFQIAHFLISLTNASRTKIVDLTQQELSHYVGLTRITIYKVFKRWTKEGIIFLQNRKIHILDYDALKSKLSA